MIRSLIRTAIVVIISVMMFVIYLLLRFVLRTRRGRIKLAERYSQLWFRVVNLVAGITVRVSGPIPPRGAMLAPNHIGYVDILALGSAIPVTFVTRTEILKWPVIGFILKSFEQPPVDRTQTRDLKTAANAITEGLREGKTLVAFLEGTSTGGDRILPYRSSILQAAIDAKVPVVPVAIKWSSSDPLVDLAEKAAYWKKAHDFGPHVWNFFSVSGTLTATITFTDAIETGNADRKKVAVMAHQRVLEITGLPGGETQ